MTARDPDLILGGFRLWVTGKTYADVEEDYGQDLLNFETSTETLWSTLRGAGTLSAAGLAGFDQDLTSIIDTLDGEAVLAAAEGGDRLVLALAMRPLGQVDAVLDLKIGYGEEDHRIVWALDQTYLDPLVRQVRALVRAYPSPFAARVLERADAVEPQRSGLASRLIDAIFGARNGPI